MSPAGSSTEALRVTVRDEGGVRIVQLSGAAGAAQADELERRLGESMATTANLVLDVSELTFVNSSGLGAIIGVQRTCRAQGRLVCLAAPREAISQILRITQLDRLIPVYPTLEAARQAAAAPT